MDELIGHGEYLTALQMSARAVIMFIVMLVLIRIGGVRIFGKRSGFDIIIMITIGSVVARGIVGASPFLSTIAAATAMIVVHRLFAWLSIKNQMTEKLIKGDRIHLYRNGKINEKNLRRASLTKMDLEESLRLETKDSALDKIESAYLETNGRISFILKKE